MATITVVITVTKTIATLNGTTMDTVIGWVKTNIIDKVPADATLNIQYSAIP